MPASPAPSAPNHLSSKALAKTRGKRWALWMLAFITGACGIAYEYTFAKLAADLLGNTAREWALTIAVMLLAMGIGADVQKRINDKQLFSRFIIIEILLATVGGWGGWVLLEVFSLTRLHFTSVQLGLHFTIGFLIGMEIPLLLRMNARFYPTLRVNVGQILRLDYWGGFIGALVWVYLLITWLPTTLHVAFIISGVNLLSIILALFSYRHETKEQRWLWVYFVCAGVVFLSFIYGMIYTTEWSISREQRLFSDKIIVRQTTRYQHIVVTENSAGDLRLYLNGQLQFSSQDEYIYHEMLVHPALFLAQYPPAPHIAPVAPVGLRVLVLGGGDGLAVRELLKYPNVHKIYLVDIDPELIALAQTHPKLTALNQASLSAARLKISHHGKNTFTPPQITQFPLIDRSQAPHKQVGTQTLEIYTLDAYAFLKTLHQRDFTNATFDVIIADFPDPNKIELSKLYTLSFYRYIKTLLAPHGVFIQQASSPYYAQNTFQLIGQTLHYAGFSVIALKQWIPSFGQWGWYLVQHPTTRSPTAIYTALAGHFQPAVPTRSLTALELQRALLFSPPQNANPLAPPQQQPPLLPEASPVTLPQPFPQALAPTASQRPPPFPINTLLNHLAYKTYRKELKRFQ